MFYSSSCSGLEFSLWSDTNTLISRSEISDPYLTWTLEQSIDLDKEVQQNNLFVFCKPQKLLFIFVSVGISYSMIARFDA